MVYSPRVRLKALAFSSLVNTRTSPLLSLSQDDIKPMQNTAKMNKINDRCLIQCKGFLVSCRLVQSKCEISLLGQLRFPLQIYFFFAKAMQKPPYFYELRRKREVRWREKGGRENGNKQFKKKPIGCL